MMMTMTIPILMMTTTLLLLMMMLKMIGNFNMLSHLDYLHPFFDG